MVRRLNSSSLVGNLSGRAFAAVGALFKSGQSMDGWSTSRLRDYLCVVMHPAGYGAGRRRIRKRPGTSGLDIDLERARQNERARIARDLHDQTGQQLALLKLSLRALRNEIHSPLGEATLAQVNRLVDDLAQDLHGVVVGLRPAGLDEFGLIPVLETLVEDWCFSTGIRVSIREIGNNPERNPDIELALYRIAQESLTNIGRHALTSSEVTIIVHCTKDYIALTVENVGADIAGPASVALLGRSDSAHCGIEGMRERLFAYGGWLDVTSRPDGGMRVSAQIPLRR